MRRAYQTTEEQRRLSLTLPRSLFEELEGVVKEENTTYVGTIRRAIEDWLELRKARKMEAGYVAAADENRELMEEFKHVDEEGW